MSNSKKKVNFTHQGVTYNQIEVGTGRGLSKLIKTYCKKVLDLKVGTRYSCYAGGDSMTITIKSDLPFSQDDVWSYGSLLEDEFQSGSFDAMTDMQGYKSFNFQDITCEDGSVESFSAKFIHVEL
jgi:hypothetical protein